MNKPQAFFGILALICLILGILFFGSCCNKTEECTINNDSQIVLNNIQTRTSVREFKENTPVSTQAVDELMKAGMAAPSGMDRRPWQFVIIDHRETLDQLAQELPYARMLAQAPMAIVVCGDSSRSPYWYLDCSLAGENILLAAHALGLGATWTAAYPYEDRIASVRKYTNIPQNIVPLTVIPLGHPAKEQTPKMKYDSTRIHFNKW